MKMENFPLKKGVFTISSGPLLRWRKSSEWLLTIGCSPQWWLGLGISRAVYLLGWYTTQMAKTYLIHQDPRHPALIGDAEINGQSYYFRFGLWSSKIGGLIEPMVLVLGWEKSTHQEVGLLRLMASNFYFWSKRFQAPHVCWCHPNPSGTYYLMSLLAWPNNWVQLPEGGLGLGTMAAFASGWFTTPNGKILILDPAKPSYPKLILRTHYWW